MDFGGEIETMPLIQRIKGGIGVALVAMGICASGCSPQEPAPEYMAFVAPNDGGLWVQEIAALADVRMADKGMSREAVDRIVAILLNDSDGDVHITYTVQFGDRYPRAIVATEDESAIDIKALWPITKAIDTAHSSETDPQIMALLAKAHFRLAELLWNEAWHSRRDNRLVAALAEQNLRIGISRLANTDVPAAVTEQAQRRADMMRAWQRKGL